MGATTPESATLVRPADDHVVAAVSGAPVATARPGVAEVPGYRVVILGAGRSARGGLPTAIVDIGRQGCVLDWLLSAFSVLPSPDVHFVSGYKAGTIMNRFPKIRFDFNPEWETTGPARSLSVSPLVSRHATYVSYADVVFRPETVALLDTEEADVVVAVDTCWRVRYEGRSRPEMDGAEKVVHDGIRLLDIGKHIATTAATAEFAGLVRFSGQTAAHLQEMLASGRFAESDGLPEVIRLLVEQGASTAVVDINGQWAELNAPQDLARFVLGTKAESLARLRPLVRLGHIGESVSFTHQEWDQDRAAVIDRIQNTFRNVNVIVRSSALTEDSWRQSSAGMYTSVPDVPVGHIRRLVEAIGEVLHSYGEPMPDNQVLVQEMLANVTMSGVVMTRTPTLGAPYYVINYDNTSARTDTVTAGDGSSLRTMFLHREMMLRPGLPPELYRLLGVVQEIEQLVGHDSLDIEFAFTTDGVAHVLQVRPIAVAHLDQPVDDDRIEASIRDAVRFFRELQRPRPHLLGRSTQLSVMTDWNPAEIVGTKPSRLAFSLYRHLITDETWARQRAEYGYRDVRPCNLLVDLLGHPYIDVRATFNSFIPASLPDESASRLLEHYLDYLSLYPHLHDKVEFDVLFTCITFDFDRRTDRLREAGFSEDEIRQLRDALTAITRNGMARCEADWAVLDESQRRFERIRAAHLPPLEKGFLYLEDARLHSVPAFAHLARNGFVAAGLLRSLCAVGILSTQQKDAFLATIRTVSSRLQSDARAVARGELDWPAFVDRYGHLRPGTYDITSPHYASAAGEYLCPVVEAARAEEAAEPTGAEDPWDELTRRKIDRALADLGLEVDSRAFERFVRRAIEGREFSKFVFTRNLSAAIEAVARFGSAYSVSREELSHIRIADLFALRAAGAEDVGLRLKRLAAEGREAYGVTQAVCLPGQIRSELDIVCFEQLRAQPNFITQKKVRALVAFLSNKTSPDIDLAGKIVLTPNADPGFDWIFSRDIAGLLTMHGGANSHMAIRAAEFQLPAATGIGELLYEQVSKAEMIELDCASRQIRMIR